MNTGELFRKTLLARAIVLSAANVHAQQIEKVVVTATKRVESLQDVPSNNLPVQNKADKNMIALKAPLRVEFVEPLCNKSDILVADGVTPHSAGQTPAASPLKSPKMAPSPESPETWSR